VRKWLIGILAAIIMIVSGGYVYSGYVSGDFCRLDGNNVCYDANNEFFKVESRSKITIALPSKAMQDWFLDQFYLAHPGHTVNFDFRIIENLSAQQALDLGVDIFYTDTHQAALLFDRLTPFDSRINDEMSAEGIDQFTEVINMEDVLFRPFSYQGLLFVYNKTMLEALGYDVSTVTDTNLPQMFSRWEDLIELAREWKSVPHIYNQKEINIVFPLTFEEKWQFYPFLTAGDWHMFEDNDATQAGFDQENFLASLNFLKTLGEVTWDYSAQPKDDWLYEKVINEQIAPFGMAGPWMFVEQIEGLKSVDYVFSAFPTYQDKQLKPLVIVTGLVALKNDAPSLTQEILRILSLPQATQTALDTTKKILVIARDQLGNFEMSDNRRQMSLAFTYSEIEPIVALPQNTAKLGFDFYLEADFMNILKSVYKQQLTPLEAQQQFIDLYQSWLSENNR
jgi:ABC-type glycerol-3-phosphate transport system substrate-binding protein